MLIERPLEDVDVCRVLIFVGSDEDTSSVARALHEHGISTLSCHTPAELSTEIEIGGAAVVIAEDCLRTDDGEVIIHALADQRFADVPLIVLSENQDRDELMRRVSKVSKTLRWMSPYPSDGFVALVEEFVTAKQQVQSK